MESSSATASASPAMDVEEEVKCPICKEYLTDPVTLDCGHNFCRGCISQYCEKWEDLGDLECPLCKARIKKGNFRPNWQLANIAEKIKCLSLSLGKEQLCVRHKEKLHLFCKEDQELVCLICERSPEHRSHTILLLEEAAKECRDKLCSGLEFLRKETERVLASKAQTEKESQYMLGQIEQKKAKTVALFNQLYRFLEEKKILLLSQLEELEKETTTKTEEHMARLAEELSSLEDLIQKMEEKCQQPATELLQDIRRTLQSYEEKEAFENPVAFPPVLTYRIREFRGVKSILEGVKRQLEKEFIHANVILDPNTAHHCLRLSENCKCVGWQFMPQPLPSNPGRFDRGRFVLGLHGFTAGRHFWEVTVFEDGEWAVGVARKSVRRKGLDSFRPEDGIWAVGKWDGQYRAGTSPSKDKPLSWAWGKNIYKDPKAPFNALNSINSTSLLFSESVKKIRVFLDYDVGEVFFTNANTEECIYAYSRASFCGETILPFFYVDGKTEVVLGRKPSFQAFLSFFSCLE